MEALLQSEVRSKIKTFKLDTIAVTPPLSGMRMYIAGYAICMPVQIRQQVGGTTHHTPSEVAYNADSDLDTHAS